MLLTNSVVSNSRFHPLTKLFFLSTATVSLNVFDTLFTMSLHEVIVTTSITALGIFGNMCYTVAVK